jgi:hypothetical protein
MDESRSARTTVMDMLRGAWVCQAITAVTRLGVPDIVQKHGPLTPTQLTEDHALQVSPLFLARVLRACASVGIFTESAEGRFGATPLSEVLTAGAAGTLKGFADLIGGAWWPTWGGLPEVLKAGAAPARTKAGPAPWDYKSDPAGMKRFAEAMKAKGPALQSAIERCDLSGVRTLVDVGGGFGQMAIGMLERHPRLRAVVLELAELVPVGEALAAREYPEVAPRLSFVAGDMFADVPAGDAYLLCRVIHDWDDASCVRVLRNCRARSTGNGRVICIDATLPPLGDTGGAAVKFMDLMMMLTLPGRERTQAEWNALFEEAGLRPVSVTRLDDNGMSLIETVAGPDRPAATP